MYTLYTPSRKSYQYMYMSTDSRFFVFRVKACNDAVIALSKEPGVVTDNTYELVIGGEQNKAIYVRKIIAGTNETKRRMSRDNLLSCSEFRPFWVTWRSSIITVGRGLTIGYENIFNWQDSEPMTVTGIALTTDMGATGMWEIQQDQGIRYLK